MTTVCPKWIHIDHSCLFGPHMRLIVVAIHPDWHFSTTRPPLYHFWDNSSRIHSSSRIHVRSLVLTTFAQRNSATGMGELNLVHSFFRLTILESRIIPTQSKSTHIPEIVTEYVDSEFNTSEKTMCGLMPE